MVDLILKQSSTRHPPRPGLRNRHGRGLKAMALEGHGIAFLPHSAVKKELRARTLVSAMHRRMPGWR
jgi:DNA-binding transcriptional LysR family regulator